MADADKIFGTGNDVAEITKDHALDLIDDRDGLETQRFVLSINDPIRKRKDDYTEHGIAKSGAGVEDNSLGVNFRSATYTMEEITTDAYQGATTKFATDEGATPVAGDKLTCTKAMLWLQTKYTVRLEGKHAMPEAIKRGTVLATLVLKSATGETAIINETDLLCEDTSESGFNTEWHSWSATLSKFVENVDPDASTLAASLTLIDDETEITSAYYKITIEKRLAEDRPMDLSESVEQYDDVADSTL